MPAGLLAPHLHVYSNQPLSTISRAVRPTASASCAGRLYRPAGYDSAHSDKGLHNAILQQVTILPTRRIVTVHHKFITNKARMWVIAALPLSCCGAKSKAIPKA